MRADRVDTWVTPRQSAGLGVDFGLRRTQAWSVVLHDASGAPLPVGSSVRLPGGRSATVGYDGETYLEDVALPAELQVQVPNGYCRVHVAPTVTATSPGATRIGPLRCLPAPAP
jgi:outer membrane usher protein